MSAPELKVSEIRALLIGQCPGLLHDLVPHLRREGRVYTAPNPTRGETKAGSFKVWPNGAWREYDEAEDIGKGDIIGLIAYVAGLPPRSSEGRRHAIRWAKERLGLSGAGADRLQQTRRGLARVAAERKREQELEEIRRAGRMFRRALDVWSHTVEDDVALGRYLGNRGIELGAIANRVRGLRVHRALDHWAMPHQQPWRGPAMVARIVNGAGAMTAVHATFLRDDFSDKVPIETMPNRKLMLGQVAGGIVPLTYGPRNLPVYHACERGLADTVILAEGIETGLAIAMAVPEARVWACLSLGNIANAPVHLACVADIVMAFENDVKPQALRQRDRVFETLEKSGKPVRPMEPHKGSDFADVMKGDE